MKKGAYKQENAILIGLEKLAQFSGLVFLLLREKSREVFGNVYDLPIKKSPHMPADIFPRTNLPSKIVNKFFKLVAAKSRIWKFS